MKYKYQTGSRNSARYFFVRYCSIISLFFITACHQEKPINVIIVTFDTTRADHIGVYGKKNANTPNLDNLAKDGVVYEFAMSSIPITLPSHSTIMTGKSPFVHGVRDNGLYILSDQQTTIAEILNDQGYKTAAAIGSFPLTSQFGINQGFDFFNEHITIKQEDMYGDKTIPKEALFFDERTSTQVNDGIMPWIESHYKSPFFIWFHYFDPHHPHEPPPPYNQHFINDLYQGEIAYSDESLGNVIAQLKRLGVYDNSLIIFTSDHGEGNGEHKEETHSMLVYNSTLHVPLIVKYPKQLNANKRIKSRVALVDVFPTILSVLNIDLEQYSDIQGHILPKDDKDAKDHEIYIETLSAKLSRGWGEQRGLIKDDYKYIHGPQQELYNLSNDPRELINVIAEQSKLAHQMKSDLQEYLDEYKPEITANNTAEMSPKTLNILRGLGYIQSSGNATVEILEHLDESGDPPQIHVESITFQSTAKQLLFQKKYLEATRYIDALLEGDPDNLAFIELKIQTDMVLGNISDAKKALEMLPTNSYGTLTPEKRLELLAKIALSENNLVLAKKLFLESSAIETSVIVQYELSKIAAQEGDFELQQSYLNTLLELDSNTRKVETLNELAISYARDGDLLNAENSFIDALAHDPYNSESYYNYGIYLKSVHDFNSAINQFKKSIEINKMSLDAYIGVIDTHLQMGQVGLANNYFQKLIHIAPNSKQTKMANDLLNGFKQ